MSLFHNFFKGLATGALLGRFSYDAVVHPGPLDFLNGCIVGLVLYAIWFAADKHEYQKREKPD